MTILCRFPLLGKEWILLVIINSIVGKNKLSDIDYIKKLMNEKPVLIDVRGMFDKDIAVENGFNYKTL